MWCSFFKTQRYFKVLFIISTDDINNDKWNKISIIIYRIRNKNVLILTQKRIKINNIYHLRKTFFVGINWLFWRQNSIIQFYKLSCNVCRFIVCFYRIILRFFCNIFFCVCIVWVYGRLYIFLIENKITNDFLYYILRSLCTSILFLHKSQCCDMDWPHYMTKDTKLFSSFLTSLYI